MDFDYFLTKVQSNLMSAQKMVGMKLADIEPENHEARDSVVQSFVSLMQTLKCDEDTLRRINLFLVINTDLYSAPLIEMDVHFCHLYRAIPMISRFLYFELLVNTDLYKSASDIVKFCPEVLAVDVLPVITRYMYRCPPSMFVSFFSSLVRSIYIKIVLLVQQCKPAEITQTFTKMLQKIIDFSVDNLKACEDWNKLQKYCYFGHLFKSHLNIIEECIKLNKSDIEENIEMFNIKIEYNYSQWGPSAAEKDWPLVNLSNLVFRTKTLALEVTVEAYMSWVEDDVDDTTLQMKVREAAYTCREALENFNEIESLSGVAFLIKVLNNFAIKPRDLEDEIATADLDKMADQICVSNGSQKKWLNALLNADGALCNKNVVSKISSVTEVFDVPLLVRFIKLSVKEISSGSSMSDQLKDIIFKSIRTLSCSQQLEVLSMVYLEIGPGNVLKANNFSSNLTETFNKIVLESDKMEELYPDIIILILQSVKDVIPHLVDECLKSQVRCDILISLLKKIEVLSKVPYSDDERTSLIFSIVIKKFEEICRNCPEDRVNFLHMVEQFVCSGVIDGKQFLLKTLIPTIQNLVSKKKWSEVDLCLDIFSIYVEGKAGDGMDGKTAEVLVFLSQVLDRARLQPPAFTRASASVCDKTAHFVFRLTNELVSSKNVSDPEIEWLKEMAKKCTPFSRFHLRKLWHNDLPPDSSGLLLWATQDLGVVDWESLATNDRAILVTSLCKVLPLLTASEWKMIGYEICGAKRVVQCAAVFHAVADAVLVLAQLPVLLTNPVCLGSVLSNFIGFVKAKVTVNMKHMQRTECSSIVGKLCVICSELPEAVVRSRSAALIQLVRETISITVGKSEAGTCADLVSAVSSISEPTLRAALANAVVAELS